jgi:hypothetical protein
MLEGIFGNASAEKVLLYLEQYGEGYATAIARTFDGLSLNMAQRQLERFERAGALISSLQGRTRLYTWNPRYPFRRELRALLRKALDQLPDSAAPSGQAALSKKPRISERTSLEDLAALVCSTLEAHGISVVLSGGAVVSIYSDAEYVSYDLDFIPMGLARKVDAAMESLGFRRAATGSSSHLVPSRSEKKRSATSRNARRGWGRCGCWLRPSVSWIGSPGTSTTRTRSASNRRSKSQRGIRSI